MARTEIHSEGRKHLFTESARPSRAPCVSPEGSALSCSRWSCLQSDDFEPDLLAEISKSILNVACELLVPSLCWVRTAPLFLDNHTFSHFNIMNWVKVGLRWAFLYVLSWVEEWVKSVGRREKDPHPQDFSLTKKTARFTKGQFRPY